MYIFIHLKNRPNFEDAPHGSTIFIKILRTLRTGARFSSTFSGRSARERDFERKNDEIFRMLRAGARFSSNFARERDFEPTIDKNFEDAPHGSTISFNILRMLRTGARFSSKISRMVCRGARCSYKLAGCSARERDFEQWRRRESYTTPISETSARCRPLEPRKPS